MQERNLKDLLTDIFCSDYEYSSTLEVVHKECQQKACILDMSQEVDAQTLRDCRAESHCMELKGQVMKCRYCAERDLPAESSKVSTVTLTNMALESIKHAKCSEPIVCNFFCQEKDLT